MRDAYIEFLLITILLLAYYITRNNIEYLVSGGGYISDFTLKTINCTTTNTATYTF